MARTGLSASCVSGHPADVVGVALDLRSSPSVATAITRASRARPSMTLLMSLS